MKHGYYVAKTRRCFGDPKLALEAGRAWRRLGHKAPSVVCGAAAWDGKVRIAALDIFKDEPPRVLVVDQ